MGASYSPNIVKDGLVFYADAANPRSYPGSGTVVNSMIGKGVSGSLSSTPMFDTDSIGNFDFDNTDTIQFNLGSPLSNSQYLTVGCWMNIDVFENPASANSNGGGVFHLTKNNGTFTGGGFAANTYFTQLRWNVRNNSSNYAFLNGASTDPGTDTWFYYTGTFDGTQSTNITKTKLYINGLQRVLSFNGTQPTSLPSFTSADILYWGVAENYNWYLNGQISNMHIYNRTLTGQEIIQNYNALKGRFGL